MREIERFAPGPGAGRELESQHLSRYDFASRFTAGKRVIDIACGTGYGSSLLRRRGASSVLGIDISAEAIAHAGARYASGGVRFVCGDVSLLRDSGPADCIVSFETIEHLVDPASLLTPARDLLADGGIMIVSTPVRRGGSLSDRPENPFHVREWTEGEFDELLAGYFARREFHYQYLYRRRPYPMSRTLNRALLRALYPGRSAGFAGFPVRERPWDLPDALVERGYMVAVCSVGAR